MLSLFGAYLSSLGLKTDLVESGDKALDYFGNSRENGRPYDAILLDTHLVNPSGLDVAKKIRSEKPDQKLVLVTTTPKENLPKDCLRIAGIKDRDILTIPFTMSKLVTMVKDQLTS